MTASSLADRLGGLILAGFSGTRAADAPVDFLKTLAGVILFTRNLESAPQAAALIADLQSAAEADGAQRLIVSIDEEGGIVSRIAPFGTQMPSAMALGAALDPAVTRRAYGIIGDELAALGVTLDFAPVADVNSNRQNPVIGVRSFGDDAAAVAERVRAAILGLHDAGVGATAKHFPGHGDASVDSHGDLPVIDRDLARLQQVELVPFRAAVDASVDAIMTAHIAIPAVDASGLPATLSRIMLTDILRHELEYEGVICTDCMQMQAIAATKTAGDAAVMAVGAGADLVAFSSSVESAREAVAALGSALANGRLDPAQVEQSLARVAALRAKAQRRTATGLESVGGEPHRTAALEVARKTVTIVRDPQSLLPLRLQPSQRIFLVQFAGAAGTPVESTGKQSTRFGKLLAQAPVRVQEQLRSLDPAGHEYKQLLMAAGSGDAIVAVTRRAWSHPLQARAVADLALAGKPLIVIVAREPYDGDFAPPDAAVIATYGDDDASMEAAADILLGTYLAAGRLPVTLHGPEAQSAGAVS